MAQSPGHDGHGTDVGSPENETRRLLEALGYEVRVREAVISQCLIERGRERWLGHGKDASSALSDAIDQMFPSEAARSALAALTATGTDQAASLRRTEVPASAPSGGVEAATEHRATVIVSPPPQFASTGARHPRVSNDALHASVNEVHAIQDEIEHAEDELASLSPRLLQLNMLAWLSRARALQDKCGNDPKIRAPVSHVASILGALSKRYWPGNVPALRVDAWPESAAEIVGRRRDPPRTWEDVGDAAESAIARLIAEDTGVDDTGWSDHDSATPPPRDPAGLLETCVDYVEGTLGRTDAPPSPRDQRLVEDLTDNDVAQLAEHAKQLRWLRRSTHDLLAWGRVMGRLRWVAQKLGARGRALERELDPAHRPAGSWHDELNAREGPGARAARITLIDSDDSHDPAERLFALAREVTQGKSAVFVGTREDPSLKGQLERTFGMALDWCGDPGEPVQRMAQRVRQGTYDLVVAATGFGRHADAQTLAAAARDAGILYVRAHRGRPLACARAIVREHGPSLAPRARG